MKEAKANEPLSTIKFHQLTVLNFYTMPHFSENFKGSGTMATCQSISELLEFSMAELMSMSDVDHQVVEKQPVDRKAFSPEDVAEMLVAQAGKQK
ncbi:hypothetical protein D917_03696 [Trichinella nativa]|uniref:Uncharacterized protein n=1 Tax=Trichinella nativa TaxID=6335 RepID=A0A1Y3E7I6_9BILA|nr:hypothetical protein D917_03696 [Trichinella nativa]